jgi:hypothetical protein
VQICNSNSIPSNLLTVSSPERFQAAADAALAPSKLVKQMRTQIQRKSILVGATMHSIFCSATICILYRPFFYLFPAAPLHKSAGIRFGRVMLCQQPRQMPQLYRTHA